MMQGTATAVDVGVNVVLEEPAVPFGLKVPKELPSLTLLHVHVMELMEAPMGDEKDTERE
jgi:hypothetical protein